MNWLYENNAANSARFVLGTTGDNPLICVGINPSTAEPHALDATLKRVNRVAELNGFDSFIMLNVYPQRATDPNDLHLSPSPELKEENERHTAGVVDGRSLTIWAAWGDLIEKRKYLRPLLQDIVALPELAKCAWASRGMITKSGNPRHPLYVKTNAPFDALSPGVVTTRGPGQ